jgi:TetR/AcrR family transcriptional regulator, regulator of autoinduction and epiphytic fitness
MAAEVTTRRQHSPLRQAQAAATRVRIIQAAHTEFEARGYAGTRIEDVAARAGVAVPTVYKAFANKRTLLTAAVATAMTGGPDAPVDRQAWFHEQLDAPTAEQQLQLIARNARRLNDRAAPLLELVRVTAARDSEIATLWHGINNDRLARSRTSAKRLAVKATLRTSVPGAAHTLWALTVPELYVLHVKESGRSPEAYQRWLADVLITVLLAP